MSAVRRVRVAVAPRPNIRSNIEVAMSQTFNKEAGKVLGFLTVCKLLRMKIRDDLVEGQIQWILSYV